ncbi:hypothetical protein Vadar_031653 [Vaccinium darrowii]|uniref:Uncharacterized protein n=1 Tax=Vaccinium darrowii TaxID=229202 RepID=A0ACB7YZX3_9ERIC|nr:hypothetical protein Vadar_031653 [Vaccinium darrowii]
MDSDRLELFSLFVDNLPEDVGLNWFRKFFSQCGVVKDAYIPFKCSKVSKRRFGFVRFNCASSAEVAISKANGFWIDNRKLFVKMAAFEAQGLKPGHNGEKHDFLLSSRRVVPLMNNGSKISEKSRGLHEDRPSYAHVTRGVEGNGENLGTRSVQCHAIGNGWLYRSAIAKIRKLISAKDLECIFNLKKVIEIQIKAIGGRYVIITFANEGMRDKTLKELWVKNWFSDFHPWSGEQAKEERFVWISCFGMPLSAWSSQTFKDIGSIWGEFIEVDENTLKGGSYEKGRILIATDHSKRIEGNIELVEDGRKYIVRIEEESSFRKVESSNFLPDFDALSVHDDKLSEGPKEALSLDLGSKVDPNDNGIGSSLGLESLVEDSMGLQSLFHEAFVVEPGVKTRSQGKFLDVNSGDLFSSAMVASEGSDYDDRDLIGGIRVRIGRAMVRFGVGGSESDGGRRWGAEGDGGEMGREEVVFDFDFDAFPVVGFCCRSGGQRLEQQGVWVWVVVVGTFSRPATVVGPSAIFSDHRRRPATSAGVPATVVWLFLQFWPVVFEVELEDGKLCGLASEILSPVGSRSVELVDEGEGAPHRYGLVVQGRGLRREVWVSDIELTWLCLMLEDASSGYDKAFSRSYGGFVKRLKVNRLVFEGGFVLRVEVKDKGSVRHVFLPELGGAGGWVDVSKKFWAFCGWKRSGGLVDGRSFKDVANISGWPVNTVVVEEIGRMRKGCDVEVRVDSTESNMNFLGTCLVGRLEDDSVA